MRVHALVVLEKAQSGSDAKARCGAVDQQQFPFGRRRKEAATVVNQAHVPANAAVLALPDPFEIPVETKAVHATPNAENAISQNNRRVRIRRVMAFGISDRIKSVLSPLRNLSFWRMKDRARAFGEEVVHPFLNRLLAVRPNTRVHLMGHSFGCIVVSAGVAGPAGSQLVRPVTSLALVQGAFSLWSYADAIKAAGGQPGYFRRVMDGRVTGPIVTSQSVHDTAVGNAYPLAAGVARQVSFAPGELPRYGAVGRHGLQGKGLDVIDQRMLTASDDYSLEPGKVYNLEASTFIRNGGGFSGAHSDITGPEVVHAIWAAASA